MERDREVEVDLSLAGLLRGLTRALPDHRALVDCERSWSVLELDVAGADLAAALAGGGVTAGDRVAYLGSNSAAFLVTLLAAERIGAIFVPVHFRLVGQEVAALLADAAPRALVAEPERACPDALRCASGQAPALGLVVWDDDPGAVPDGWRPWSPSAAARSAAADDPDRPRCPLTPPALRRGEDDPAVIMYTSGTTGRPRGAVLTHGNLWWSWQNAAMAEDLRRGDVTLAVAPLAHIGGLNSFVLRTLVHAGTVVLRRRFDAARTLADIAEYGVTTMFAVPAMYAAMLREPSFAGTDLSTLRVPLVAGECVPRRLIREYAERGILLQQSWGMTEVGPAGTYLPVERTLDKLGSVGLPAAFTQLRLVDPDSGRDAETGEVGEIWVRGPNVSPGYWRAADDRTGGWLRSGDLATRDPDGFYYMAGRIKDVIISGGEKIDPVEVAEALRDHADVLDAAAVGAPDPTWGECVVAFVVLRPGAELDLEAARDFAARHVARFKLPRHLVAVDEIPRGPSGKADLCTLRRWAHDALAERAGPAAALVGSAPGAAPAPPRHNTTPTKRTDNV